MIIANVPEVHEAVDCVHLRKRELSIGLKGFSGDIEMAYLV